MTDVRDARRIARLLEAARTRKAVEGICPARVVTHARCLGVSRGLETHSDDAHPLHESYSRPRATAPRTGKANSRRRREAE